MSAINWNYVEAQLSTLVPWSRNPKTITKQSAKRLLKLWDKLGQFQTIAIGPDGQVYDGHQRLSVLLAAYGKDYSVKCLQSSRELTDDEREQIVIGAHVGTVGQFDWSALTTWNTSSLVEWGGFDAETLTSWRQDVEALDNFLKLEEAEKELDEVTETIVPREMARILVSVPVDEAINARLILDALREIDGIEIIYGAN